MRDYHFINGLKAKLFGGLTALLILTFGTAALLPMGAMALSQGVLFVGHGATGNNRSCAAPGYNNVQTAVDAASTGSTVYLCGGQFAQQVFVSKSITLTGDSTSGLTATGTTFTTSDSSYPAQFTSQDLVIPEALLVTSGAGTNASVIGLTFSGPIVGTQSCTDQQYGILALGGSLQLNNDKVLNIASSNPGLYGCQFGVAIEIGSQQWPSASSGYVTVNFRANANMNHVTVSGYQKNGITVDGPGSSANIDGSTVTGGGRGVFGQITAQNGIQISDGAQANIEGNTISDNSYTGSGDTSATGILIFGGDGYPLVLNTNVIGNHLVNNDIGIYMGNYNSAGTNGSNSPTRDAAEGNFISNNAVTNTSGLYTRNEGYVGYQAGIEEIGNHDSLIGNQISGAGYASQGLYNDTSDFFIQTSSNKAFVRPIDAGDTFPTIAPIILGNMYDYSLTY